jgi:hypothetical protein
MIDCRQTLEVQLRVFDGSKVVAESAGWTRLASWHRSGGNCGRLPNKTLEPTSAAAALAAQRHRR